MADVKVQKIVLDVLKPMEPSMLELSRNITGLDGVESVSVDLIEIDKKVENVKLSISGTTLDYTDINAVIESTGATIHSVDYVFATKGTPPREES
ncbi:hypothetical protein GF412_02515 [Candidatus Micrarchaeota archaeon]|nr:hypothetical protein [Candidatus Micrarchaeota archaeon]MBD3417832.1 hypothetical protein [Candidatus Micrarchaeota archaeon]